MNKSDLLGIHPEKVALLLCKCKVGGYFGLFQFNLLTLPSNSAWARLIG